MANLKSSTSIQFKVTHQYQQAMSAMKPNITQLHLYFTEEDIWLKITSVFAGALRNKTKQKNLQTVYFGESLVILTPNKTKQNLLEALNSLHLVGAILATSLIWSG